MAEGSEHWAATQEAWAPITMLLVRYSFLSKHLRHQDNSKSLQNLKFISPQPLTGWP